MKEKIITIALGTIILFAWNAISWMVLPFHSNSLNNIPDEVFQGEVLRQTMPESGVYHYPGMPATDSAESMKKVEDQLKEGPRITMMVYKNSPTQLFEPMMFVKGLLINLLTVILAYYFISLIQPKNLMTIMSASIAIGLVSATVSDISLMNWYMFPADYTLINIFDKLVSFGLLGILFSLYTFKSKTDS